MLALNQLSPSYSKSLLTKKIKRLERSLFLHDQILYRHPSIWLHYYTLLDKYYYQLGEKQLARRPVSRYSHEKFWPSCPQN
jgi:hypothetical protein